MDENNLNHQNIAFPKLPGRRRSLLPWWIKAFLWIFLVFFVLMPVAIVMGLLHFNFNISLLGISTNQPVSLIGLLLILLFSLKGVTAYGLWTEQNWAVKLAKADAIISIVICFIVMGYSIFVPHQSFSIRLELIALFPYYYKMNKIQHDWENFNNQEITISTYTDPV